MKITDKEIKAAYAEIENIRSKLESLYFKMEEADDEGSDPDKFTSYVEAKNSISNASDFLLEALDNLKT